MIRRAVLLAGGLLVLGGWSAVAEAPTVDDQLAALDARISAVEAAPGVVCITSAEGVRVRMVNGRRVIVDVPDHRATFWIALVDERCIDWSPR